MKAHPITPAGGALASRSHFPSHNAAHNAALAPTPAAANSSSQPPSLLTMFPDLHIDPTLTDPSASSTDLDVRFSALDESLNEAIWPTNNNKQQQSSAAPAATSHHKHSESFDPSVLVRASKNASTASTAASSSTSSSVGPSNKANLAVNIPAPSPSHSHSHSMSSAVDYATLITQSDRDKEEAMLVSAVRSGNLEKLRWMLLELNTLRQDNVRLAKEKAATLQTLGMTANGYAAEKELRRSLQKQAGMELRSPNTSPRGSLQPGAGNFSTSQPDLSKLIQKNAANAAAATGGVTNARSPSNRAFLADTSGGSPSIGASTSPAAGGGEFTSPKLNGLALLKAKAAAKAKAEALAARQEEEKDTQVPPHHPAHSHSNSLPDVRGPGRLGGSNEETSTVLHVHDMESTPVRRGRLGRRVSTGSDHSSINEGDSRSSSIGRSGSDTPVRERSRVRKKKLKPLPGGAPPYHSRFDSDGSPGIAAGQAVPSVVTDVEEDYSLDAYDDYQASPRHRASLPTSSSATDLTSPVNRKKKKSSRSRSKRASMVSDQPVAEPVTVTISPPEMLTSPLFHSTNSSLPQLPHHFKRKQQDADSMSPTAGMTSSASAKSLSLIGSGIAMPGGGAASSSNISRSQLDRDRQFSPSRLQTKFEYNKKPGNSVPSTVAQPQLRAQAYTFQTGNNYGLKRLTTG